MDGGTGNGEEGEGEWIMIRVRANEYVGGRYRDVIYEVQATRMSWGTSGSGVPILTLLGDNGAGGLETKAIFTEWAAAWVDGEAVVTEAPFAGPQDAV